MRNLRPLPLYLAMLFALASTAQIPFGVKDPGVQTVAKCSECLAAINSKPKEVQFGLFDDPERNVWFVITDARYLEKLMKQGGYGFAVDVVSRDQYTCPKSEDGEAGFPKGTMLEPVYQADFKKNMQALPNGNVLILLGKLPSKMVGKKYEFNLIILKNKYLCYYNTFTNIQAFRWDLLNMGMYMDTLTYASATDTTRNDRMTSLLKRKAMRFTIPFEKSRSEYSAKDLQPLYDSLRLTDFTIRRIDIEAYSSVEGTLERNIELQEKRAQSIVAALQSFQSPNITTTVKASENWVEFLNDVSHTSHADLAYLDKEEIKKKLAEKGMADELEPMLAYHRKAVVVLELQRKDLLMDMEQEQLVKDFEKAIAEKNLDYARQLQNTVFARIMDNQLPSSFLDRLEVPVQRDFAALMTSRAAFKYFEDPSDAYETYLALKDLERLLPEDGHIKYNLCAIQFHLLIMGEHAVDPLELEKQIKTLRNFGIEQPLVTRMMINLNIIQAEMDMAKGDYSKKDTRMTYIRKNYKSVPMESSDHLSLAQYFASYANYDDAKSVISPYLSDINIDEDLLFYYLNLTIFDVEQTKKSSYRQTMLNAANKNNNRFCALFDPISEGGVTFQLLDDPILSKTYCETCR